MISQRSLVAAAAGLPSSVEAAMAYADLGLSVLPLRGKKPALLNWKIYQYRRADNFDIARWAHNGLLENLGVVCGRVSGNLVVVDLDGDEAMNAFPLRFPELAETYTVATGSGRGAHLYYTADALPPTTRYLGDRYNIELRAAGCYVVAPPSIHPDTGRGYFVTCPAPIRAAGDELRAVVAWLRRLQAARQSAPARPAAPVLVAAGEWAMAALNAEAAAVALAPEGSRNNTLNRASFKLGQLVGAGLLTRELVERELHEAATALVMADGEMAVLRTIRSGLDAGEKRPRGKAGA